MFAASVRGAIGLARDDHTCAPDSPFGFVVCDVCAWIIFTLLEAVLSRNDRLCSVHGAIFSDTSLPGSNSCIRDMTFLSSRCVQDRCTYRYGHVILLWLSFVC